MNISFVIAFGNCSMLTYKCSNYFASVLVIFSLHHATAFIQDLWPSIAPLENHWPSAVISGSVFISKSESEMCYARCSLSGYHQHTCHLTKGRSKNLKRKGGWQAPWTPPLSLPLSTALLKKFVFHTSQKYTNITFKLLFIVSCRALKPPEWKPQWHCAVRVSTNKKLVGFISAIPAHIRVYDQ